MKRIKRLFDLFFSLAGLSLIWPLFVIIAILIKAEDGGPILFGQERVGYQGRTFRILKFRTMVSSGDKTGKSITVGRDPRITGVGYWLRKFKLDELPQLFNVVKGEMSLVGPRPEVHKYVYLYTPEQRYVLKLIPGITDHASIRYRNESEILAQAKDSEKTYIEKIMPEKLQINIEYGKRATLFSDISVILKTMIAVFK